MTTRSESEDPKAAADDKIEFSVLLKFIKPFDGSREKLNPFISNCQNAYNLANKSQKPILFKYILSQLEGRAESTCNIKDFESLEQFLEFLKQQFGERKHYAHLLSELQDCKQSSIESVNQYALKIETCLAKLLTEINISIPTKRKTELTGRVAAMEDLALHTFMIGLHPRLSQIVRCRDPDNLNAAVNFAVAEEKILTSLNKRPQSPFINNERHRLPPRRDFQSRPNNFQPRPNNFQPRPNNFQPRAFQVQQNNRPEHFRNFNTNDVTCRYCKNIGHTIENCRKRLYNNRAQFNASSSNSRPNNSPPVIIPATSRRVFTADQVNDIGEDEVDHNNLNE